jgi:predicted RNA-binding Zn-ribbon protein involved in translation (DUF1610 family)
MREIRKALTQYQADTNIRLNPEQHSDWFEQLIASNYLDPHSFSMDGDPRVPVDPFGTPFQVKWEKTDAHRVASVPVLVVMSFGENCQDDGGRRDDWKLDQGPNIGYWYKSKWVTSAAIVCLAIVVAIIVRLVAIRNAMGSALLLLIMASSVAFAAFHADIDELHGRNVISRTFQAVFVAACGIAVLALLMCGYCILRVIKERKRQLSGYCPKCGYDLRQVMARGCPECGWGRIGSSP